MTPLDEEQRRIVRELNAYLDERCPAPHVPRWLSMVACFVCSALLVLALMGFLHIAQIVVQAAARSSS